MRNLACMGVLAATLAVGGASAAGAPKAQSYILNGYSFGGFPGVNTDELAAQLKDQEGARVTRADVNDDEAILVKELEARHIEGHLFTTMAERHGRIWVIFDLQKPRPPMVRHLEAQNFEGASRVPAGVLAAATGLKLGDALPPEKLDAARQSIVAAYAKAMPGKWVSVKGRLQTGPGGRATLTWIIVEPG